MVRYSYFYNSLLDLHVIMISRANDDGTVAVRPVGAYYSANSAKAYVKKANDYLATTGKGAAPRFNPPVRYFSVPDWWTESHPNWQHMCKAV